MADQFNRPPLRTITGFKSKLVGGGARPNLFEVELAFPENLGIANDVKEKSRFLVKAAALPESLRLLVTEHSIPGQSQLSMILTSSSVRHSKSG